MSGTLAGDSAAQPPDSGQIAYSSSPISGQLRGSDYTTVAAGTAMPGTRPDLRETFDTDCGMGNIRVDKTATMAHAARMMVHLVAADGPDDHWTRRLTATGGPEIQSTMALDDAAVEPDLPEWLATGLRTRTGLGVTV